MNVNIGGNAATDIDIFEDIYKVVFTPSSTAAANAVI